MANDLQDLRRSAVVSGFGPGSVVDFRADNAPISGMAAGLEEWDRSFPPAGMANTQTVRETRLQKKLGVQGFRLPPVIEQRRKDEKPDPRRLVAVRFPQWLQCPSCDVIGHVRNWSDDPGKAYRYCPDCTAKNPGGRKVFVIPVRFVMACPRGHVDEFPWHWWVGHEPECDNGNGSLILRSENAGLAGLMLRCPKCKASRPMDGIFAKQTWEHFSRCAGRRPWLANGDETCAQQPVAVQRGASNLYFAVTQSALSIPPWSDRLQECLGTFWDTLVNVDSTQREQFIELMGQGDLRPVLDELKMTPAQLAAAIENRVEKYTEINTDDLRPAEFRQFVEDPGDRLDKDLEFEIRRESVPEKIRPWISTVVRAVRLREVRAITGFTRINPPGDPSSPEVARLSKEELSWLPAIEVRGEGIFLSLNESKLSDWEAQPLVMQRAAECNALYVKDWKSRHGEEEDPPKEISPRYMLCHTFAHAMMRQLTLECGYSSASLQERIYADSGEDPMAGILIYTASPDSDGTLGGLQRQGKASRIAGIVSRALLAMEWCSSDPLCITDMMAAHASFSHSACHGCVLAPETSCETFNHFLDRGLLIGTPDNSDTGFFRDLLELV
ncbi:DrmB family protein [Parasphingorhabdus sp.]|uniref:DrmB family protein n=1 Tax=Parasphingorhabdus sp. TaxID=2709688 RepID=UPI0035946413